MKMNCGLGDSIVIIVLFLAFDKCTMVREE